jgi:hypothetical protein
MGIYPKLQLTPNNIVWAQKSLNLSFKKKPQNTKTKELI